MAASKKSAQSTAKKASSASKSKRAAPSSRAKRAAGDYERRVELQVMAFATLSVIFLIVAIVRYS